ncbi:LysE family translocator [Caldimonas thermodepolymerans]|uniref:Lysine transporter LysE n=1 Tax=Caldimonas thermodepolymerans TaxID=215580 RepID=A0A2S5T2C5_9BURK|nr:LysE family translocator [Caldimonas thermodepolymerans]PPE69092.1 lysine transporter LysE [Caldimonas thermodepolymerans]QPC32084.1 LysE family translocator [Caldimonas thermodepolymerans]RDH95902.1 threonine/homoserine/homoserine lactone efflux protein [Caldimonas thermodepolymerans]UZG44879.1 LysE family translocator [Caldimonas thermodepolymerans]
MFGIHDLALFIVSGFLLNLSPGPDSLLIMTRSAAQGWRAGCVAAWGVGAGVLVHVLAAALGLSAVLATSATAFTVVKLVGAAYLVWVGIGMLCSRAQDATVAADAALPPLPYRQIFLQGLLTNALNPKVAIFFLAFVPQFIAPDAPDKPLAFLVLGLIFDFNAMLWCNALAVGTALASRRLRIGARASTWLNRAIGGMFVALGVRLALSRQG